jgi:signal transduction histidine kinase
VATERSRIARDLHDGPVQALAGAVFALHAIGRMLESNDVESASNLVAEVRDRLSQGADELRRIVRGSRPASLESAGLAASVRTMTDRLATDHGVSVEFEAKGCEALPPEAEHLAYRVVQQALDNAGAHAAARHVRVRLVRGARSLEAEVVDDGRGFDPSQADTFARRGRVGLASMQERATLGGGSLWIWSRPGAGTTIRLRVPLR